MSESSSGSNPSFPLVRCLFSSVDTYVRQKLPSALKDIHFRNLLLLSESEMEQLAMSVYYFTKHAHEFDSIQSFGRVNFRVWAYSVCPNPALSHPKHFKQQIERGTNRFLATIKYISPISTTTASATIVPTRASLVLSFTYSLGIIPKYLSWSPEL